MSMKEAQILARRRTRFFETKYEMKSEDIARRHVRRAITNSHNKSSESQMTPKRHLRKADENHEVVRLPMLCGIFL